MTTGWHKRHWQGQGTRVRVQRRKEKTVLVRERGPEPRDLLLFHQMIDSFHSVSLEDLNVKEKEKRKEQEHKGHERKGKGKTLKKVIVLLLCTYLPLSLQIHHIDYYIHL